jgi:hypothetical protein
MLRPALPHPWLRSLRGLIVVLLLVVSASSTGRAALDATKYHGYAELTSELQALVKAHAPIATLVEIGKSKQGRSIWAVRLAGPGGTPADTRPGLLVVGNLEGDGLLGSELALFAIDALASGYATNPEYKRQLDSTVFYVIPRLNPDAAEDYFAAVKTGRRTTLTPFDADNDGRLDEDGPEDLNKDGFITMMRVKDPDGAYAPLADDPRLMKRADPQKGEAGGWAIYWEGLDNDGDGFYNEDGVGGADLDRNFQHQYPYYAPDAGRYMVSESESRALVDFAIAHRIIAGILTVAASDNLVSAPGGRGATIDLVAFASEATTRARAAGIVLDTPPTQFFGGGPIDGSEFAPPPRPAAPARPPAPRPATTINAADLELFRSVGEKYKQLTGIRQTPAARRPAGALFEWGYFQFGVPAFSTPGWGAKSARADAPARSDAAAAAPASQPAGPPAAAGGPGTGQGGGQGGGRRQGGGGPGGAGPGGAGQGGAGAGGGAAAAAGGDAASGGTAADDLATLKWLDAEKTDGYVAWTPFKHPTLGDIEIGGFRPYALNPPAARLIELGQANTAFIVHLSTQVPRIGIAKATVTSHGGGLFRIEAEIENAGVWPTALQHAVTARAVKPVLVQLGVEPSAIVSGNPKTNLLPTLAGSGRRESYEWIVRGKPGQQVTLKVVAEKGGTVTQTLTLK